MSGEEGKYGSLLFFRKTGEPGTSYPLVIGKTSIGSSSDADIRLKLKDERLEEVHCIIDVTKTGFATIINKSLEAPIRLNTVSVRTFKVLCHEDEIDLIGKKFKYLNDNISEEDIGKHQASLNKVIGTPSQKRQSVAPVVNIHSTKKTPNFKTKTPVQRKPLSRKSFSGNYESIPESTNNKNLILLERSKTTSKVIVSKALGSPRRARKRRLTLDDNFKKQDSLKISERNILLSDNIVSSTMSEEKLVPSVTRLKADDVSDFLDLSNKSLSTYEDGSAVPTSIRRSSMRTPSRSSISTVTEPTPNKTPKSNISKTLLTPAKTETPKTATPRHDEFNSTKSKVKTPKNTPLINKRLELPKTATPRHDEFNSSKSKVKTPKNTPLINKRLELLKGTPNSTRKSVRSPKTVRSTDLDETPPLSSKTRLTENIGTPSSSKVPPSSSKVQISDTKTKQRSFGSIPPPNKSMSTRRKTEGSCPINNVLNRHSMPSGGRKSNITSVDSADLSEGMEILNISDSSVSPIPPRTGLSSTDSDPFEEQISKDPRLSLGKVSPRKSIRKSRHTDQRSSAIRDEEHFLGNSESVPEDMARNGLENSSSVRRSNMLKTQEKEPSLDLSHDSMKEDLKVADSAASSFRTSATRRSFRKSNLKEASESELSSEESALSNLPDESFSSTASSTNDSDAFELPSANESRKSIRKSRHTDQRSSAIRDEEHFLGNSESVPEDMARNGLENSSTVRRSNILKTQEKEPSLDLSHESMEEDLKVADSAASSFRTSATRRSFRKSNLKEASESELSSEESALSNLPDESFSSTASSTNDSDAFELPSANESRKSIRKSRHTDQRSSAIRDEEHFLGNSESVPEDMARNGLENSSTVRRSNILKTQEKEPSLDLSHESMEEDLKVADSAASSFRTSATRRSFRKSNLKEASESELSSEESALSNLPDESFSSTASSTNDSDTFELPSANKSRRSSHRSDITKKDRASSEISDVKPVFFPQSRRPLRSYADENKELSVRLSRSVTSQGEGNQRYSLDSNTKTKNEENSLNQSTLSNVSTRISPRKSTGKYCKSCEISPIKSLTPRRSSVRDSTISIFDESISSESDSKSPTKKTGQYTPKPRNSVSINKSQAEEEISDVESLNKSVHSKRLSRNGNKSINSSVILVDDDSIKGTPENNTSIVILDTPLEKPRRISHKKLSKTLNSSIEDCVELTTPKSAIKSRRSKSLPYKPIVEEITPVTPQEVSRKESGFKTPLNTPGLFENIKNSVLKSRSRRRPSSNLMEELNKAAKRPRESTESVDRSPKKRKMLTDSTMDFTADEDLDASFGSFGTDEIFTDDNTDEYVAPNTPHDFRNLTDKPLITDPQAKSLTEPRKQRLAPNRRSLHAMRLESQFSESDNASHSKSSNDSDISDSFTDASVGSRRSRRLSLKTQKESPQNKAEKPPKSPKNDLTDVRGIRRLLQTPKPVRSPKNDLSNIVGVKKLLSTPNVVKSPKNDLTRIPNLRKLVYPGQQNSPKNDLSNVTGVKKLLGTPKEVKTPRNDLRNVPNLRRVMSPKQQNSPRNDLSDIAGLKKLLSTPKKQKEPKNDLTNVAGVKKLMSTPKQQNSPFNDLTKVPNLRKMMSPKQQNSPRNDLSDVEGVADIFTETEVYNSKSDIENNEDLFDKLFVKKPIRTYRGKSLSPITRKAMLFGQDHNKTLGNTPVSSPRIEKWLEDQAVFKQRKIKDAEKTSTKQLKEENNYTRATPQKKKAVDAEETEFKEKPKGRSKALHIETAESPVVESPRSLRRGKNIVTESAMINLTDSTSTTPKLNSPAPTKRGRGRKVSHREEVEDQVEKKPKGKPKARHIDTVDQVVESPRSLGTRQRDIGTESPMTDIIESTTTKSKSPAPTKRGRVRKVSQREETEDQVEEKPRGRPKALHIETVENPAVESPRSLRRQRNIGTKSPKPDIVESTSTSKCKSPAPIRHGRVRKMSQREETEDQVKEKPRGRPKALHIDTVDQVESLGSLATRQRDIGTESPMTDIVESTTTSKSKSPAPTKRGRVRKVSQREETEDQVEEKPRGRPKALHIETVENPAVESPRSLRRQRDIGTKSPKPDIVESTSTSKFKSPAPTRHGRVRKMSQSEETEDQVEEEPRKTATALHIETIDNPVVESPRSLRSRRRNIATENPMTDIVDSTSTASKIQSPAPAKRGRGRKASQKEDMTQQVPEINSTTQDAKHEATTTNTEVTPLAKRRDRPRTVSRDKASALEQRPNSRRRKVPNKNENNSDNEAVPNPTSEAVAEPARRLRRRQIVIEDDELSEENNKNIRGNRRKVPKKNEDNPDGATMSNPPSEEKPEPYRKPRRNQIVIEDDDNALPEENTKNIQGSRRRKVPKKNENNSDSEVTPNPTSEKMAEPARRLRRKQIVIEDDDDELSEEENKNMRGNRRKVPKKNDNNPTSEEPVKRIQRRPKIVIEDDDEVSEVENKNVRGNRRKVPKKNDENPTSKEPARRIQRRQIVIDDDDEVSEEENKENMQANAPKRKVAKTKNQKDLQKVNVEEEIGRSKPSKKQSAKLQVEELEGVTEESPENSRKTRQRKGIFKKYGSQFVTDMKKVRFEEDEADGNKKRKGKAAEQTEIENSIRRSKRTRK